MAVDDSDLDITLKTPPNVRKIKSRSNSTATPRQHSLKNVDVSSSKKPLIKRKLAMKNNSSNATPVMNDSDKQNLNSDTNKSKPKSSLHKIAKSIPKALTPQTKSTNGIVGGTPTLVQKNSSSKSKRRSEPIRNTFK